MSGPRHFSDGSSYAERRERRKFAVSIFLGFPALVSAILYAGQLVMREDVMALILRGVSEQDAERNIEGLTEWESELLGTDYQSRVLELRERINEFHEKASNDLSRKNAYSVAECKFCDGVGSRAGDRCLRCYGTGIIPTGWSDVDELKQKRAKVDGPTVVSLEQLVAYIEQSPEHRDDALNWPELLAHELFGHPWAPENQSLRALHATMLCIIWADWGYYSTQENNPYAECKPEWLERWRMGRAAHYYRKDLEKRGYEVFTRRVSPEVINNHREHLNSPGTVKAFAARESYLRNYVKTHPLAPKPPTVVSFEHLLQYIKRSEENQRKATYWDIQYAKDFFGDPWGQEQLRTLHAFVWDSSSVYGEKDFDWYADLHPECLERWRMARAALYYRPQLEGMGYDVFQRDTPDEWIKKYKQHFRSRARQKAFAARESHLSHFLQTHPLPTPTKAAIEAAAATTAPKTVVSFERLLAFIETDAQHAKYALNWSEPLAVDFCGDPRAPEIDSLRALHATIWDAWASYAKKEHDWYGDCKPEWLEHWRMARAALYYRKRLEDRGYAVFTQQMSDDWIKKYKQFFRSRERKKAFAARESYLSHFLQTHPLPTTTKPAIETAAGTTAPNTVVSFERLLAFIETNAQHLKYALSWSEPLAVEFCGDPRAPEVDSLRALHATVWVNWSSYAGEEHDWYGDCKPEWLEHWRMARAALYYRKQLVDRGHRVVTQQRSAKDIKDYRDHLNSREAQKAFAERESYLKNYLKTHPLPAADSPKEKPVTNVASPTAGNIARPAPGKTVVSLEQLLAYFKKAPNNQKNVLDWQEVLVQPIFGDPRSPEEKSVREFHIFVWDSPQSWDGIKDGRDWYVDCKPEWIELWRMCRAALYYRKQLEQKGFDVFYRQYDDNLMPWFNKQINSKEATGAFRHRRQYLESLLRGGP